MYVKLREIVAGSYRTACSDNVTVYVLQGVVPETLEVFRREDYENHQFLDNEGIF